MEYKVRISPRLQRYDYSNFGSYFITLCCHDKKNLFGEPMKPHPAKQIVQDVIKLAKEHETHFRIIHSVVMPNHLHLLISKTSDSDVTVSDFVRRLKSYSTKQLRIAEKNGQIQKLPENIWQRSFHDRVVRNAMEFENMWTYIENNPRKWELDCFYKG